MLEIQQRASGSGESAAGAMYLSLKILSHLPQLYLVIQAKVQFEHSSHIVNVGVEATC